MLTILAFNKFNISIWKKPPPVASVVWTQTVKRPKPTIPDKLPAPLVPLKKAEEPKKEEINIKKEVANKKPEPENAKDKMKKALENLKNKVVDEDDRPTPKEDNFATADDKKPEGMLSDQQILSMQATTAYGLYIQTIKETVTSNFIWYKTGANFVTEVSMKIDPKGLVNNAKVTKSSGDFAYDQAVLRAIQKSSPLPPPPDELLQLFIQDEVQINFERKQ